MKIVKAINLIILLTLVSCSSVPKGSRIMRQEIKDDQKNSSAHKNVNYVSVKGKRVQVIRGYAKVMDDNILNLESIYYVPLPEGDIDWSKSGALKK